MPQAQRAPLTGLLRTVVLRAGIRVIREELDQLELTIDGTATKGASRRRLSGDNGAVRQRRLPAPRRASRPNRAPRGALVAAIVAVLKEEGGALRPIEIAPRLCQHDYNSGDADTRVLCGRVSTCLQKNLGTFTGLGRQEGWVLKAGEK